MKKNKRCYFCHGGPVVEGTTYHVSRMNGRLVEVEDVPCDICQQCGEKYFEPKTIRKLEQIIKLKSKVREYIRLPVYSYV